MKKILLIIIIIIGVNSAYARCTSSGIQIFPEQKEISQNSMFIIEGYSSSQVTIESFKTRTIYLESESGEKIELIMQEILKGQMDLTQAIFKPNRELNPNTKYFLKYSNQTEKESKEMKRWNSEKNERELVYWETTNKKNVELLNKKLKIKYQNTKVDYFGDGPSANASFKVKNKAKAVVWYKTELIDITTNEKTIFYIRELKGSLDVGHNMCSGAFTYNKEGEYKVRFTPMNIDGKSLKTTSWKTFSSPFWIR